MPPIALNEIPADVEPVAEEQHASARISCDTSEPGSAADSEQPTTEPAATPLDETAGPTETTSTEVDEVVEETTPTAAAPNAEDAVPANHSRELPLGEEETPVVEAAATPVEAGRPEAAEVVDANVADEIEADVGEDAEPEVGVAVATEEEGDARAGEWSNGISYSIDGVVLV